MVKTRKFNGVTYRESQFDFVKKSDAEKAARILRNWKQVTAGKQQSTAARVVPRITRAGKKRYAVYTGKTRWRTGQ